MLMFTDIVISDYSGAFLDFILLDRPVIHFVYDYKYYKDVDSGLYYDIEDFGAGAITSTLEELIKELQQLLSGKDEYCCKRKYVREKYMKYEIGKSSQMIVETVIHGKQK